MPKTKRSKSPLSVDDFDDGFSEDQCSTSSKSPPVQRNAANARERARMRVLSSAFCRLKTKLPWVPADTKLSKLDTLRLATIYIRQLRMRLSGDDDSSQMSQQTQKFQIEAPTSINGNQQSLVWPFSFQPNAPENRSSYDVNANGIHHKTDSNQPLQSQQPPISHEYKEQFRRDFFIDSNIAASINRCNYLNYKTS